MKKCIFCLSVNELSFNTIEHILPESLGGGDWAVLPEGLFCDSCQNVFGSSIEQQALADYPFINLRTFIGIPTKKKKAPWFKNWEGILTSSGVPGMLMYEPNEHFQNAAFSGKKTVMTLPAESKRSDMILRTLLKIGLECIAAGENSLSVFEEQYNPARVYALSGIKDCPWSYFQREDIALLNRYLTEKIWDDHHFSMGIEHYKSGMVLLHLRLCYLEFYVPLVKNIVENDFVVNEPQERLIIV